MSEEIKTTMMMGLITHRMKKLQVSLKLRIQEELKLEKDWA